MRSDDDFKEERIEAATVRFPPFTMHGKLFPLLKLLDLLAVWLRQVMRFLFPASQRRFM